MLEYKKGIKMTYQVIKVSNSCQLIGNILNTTVGTLYTIDYLLDRNAQQSTKINDFVFLVLGGNHADSCINNLNYNNGLKAFARINSLPVSMPNKPTHYQVEIEILFVLPNTVTKNNFYLYPDLVDIWSIGASTKGEKNQAVSLISQINFENIIKALIDLGYLNNQNNAILNQFNIINNQLRKCTIGTIQV
jgi:hypothetical protein